MPTEFIDRLTTTMTAGLADDLAFAPTLARHRRPVSLLIRLRLELEPPVTAELACSVTRMDRY